MAKNVTRMSVFRPAAGVSVAESLAETIREARVKNHFSLMVRSPKDLGASYEELVAALDAIAEADLAVMFVPPNHR